MSRVCIICNKKPVKGTMVSHAKNRTKKWTKPNLQRVKIILNNKRQKAFVCTTCIKSGKIKKAN